jgi:hypothetical protein
VDRDEVLSEDEDEAFGTVGRGALHVRPSEDPARSEPKLPFPKHLDEAFDRAREPQRTAVDAGGDTSSSTETIEGVVNKAKLETAGNVEEEDGRSSTRSTHQSEQEENGKLW